jgi:hypothetical protein
MGLELGDAIIPSPWKLLSWRILIWLKTSDLLTLPRLFNCNFHLLQLHVGQRLGENSPISVFASFSGLTDKLHAPTPLVSQWDHVTISHQYNRTRMFVSDHKASKEIKEEEWFLEGKKWLIIVSTIHWALLCIRY